MDLILKERVLKEMRNPEIYKERVIDYIEKRIPYVFGVACEKELSINEWQPNESFGDQIGHKTVLLTVRMFDLWETAIIDILNEKLNKLNVKVIPSYDAIGDFILIFPDKSEMKWEIKTSQAEDSFTGATHSSSKCNNYVLINYSIDKNKKLNLKENKKIVKELAVFVWDNMEAKWAGLPTQNSSFTTLKIPSEIAETRPEIVVVGRLDPKKKWCRFIRENKSDYRLI